MEHFSYVEFVVFDGLYFEYYENPGSKSKESIAEKAKLRRQRQFDEIAKKEKMISCKLLEKYFCYSSPSDIYKALKETTGSEKNKA